MQRGDHFEVCLLGYPGPPPPPLGALNSLKDPPPPHPPPPNRAQKVFGGGGRGQDLSLNARPGFYPNEMKLLKVAPSRPLFKPREEAHKWELVVLSFIQLSPLHSFARVVYPGLWCAPLCPPVPYWDPRKESEQFCMAMASRESTRERTNSKIRGFLGCVLEPFHNTNLPKS